MRLTSGKTNLPKPGSLSVIFEPFEAAGFCDSVHFLTGQYRYHECELEIPIWDKVMLRSTDDSQGDDNMFVSIDSVG